MLTKNTLNIEPRVRLLILICSLIIGVFCNNIYVLLAYYILYILPLILLNRKIRVHFTVIIFGFLPIFFSFILLYIFVINDPNKSWLFIFQKMLQIIIFTSVFQALFLIPNKQFIDFLTSIGVRGENLLMVLGGITSTRDLINRGNIIIDARFSRGFMKKRTLINKLIQLPKLFIPLIIGVLRTSHERADNWQQKRILALLNNYSNNLEKLKYDSLYNSTLILIIVVFLILSFL